MIVRVPASSANLGAGFDSLGLAWQLYDRISFQPAESGLHISGCDERFQNEQNLAFAAFRRTLASCGKKVGGLAIRFEQCDIPVSRGLGSSAALIAAGVLAANALGSLGLEQEQLLMLAAEEEGHPDNVAPALLGGLTASFTEEGRVFSRRFPVSDRLRFALLIPPFELSTKRARSVLPACVSLADTVYTLSHAALLPRAFADGDTDLLRFVMRDRLHQPPRFPLIEGADLACAAAGSCGAAAVCISGAGSTLLAVSDREDFAPSLRAALTELLPAWRCLSPLPDLRGALVLP